jgi:hypothetical protein
LVPYLPIDLLKRVSKAAERMKEPGIDVRLALARRRAESEGCPVPKDLLDELRAYPNLAGRANRLVSVLSSLPHPTAAVMIEKVLALTCELEEPTSKSSVLIGVAAHLEEDRRPEILRQALFATGASEEPYVLADLVTAVAALAPSERDRLVREVLTVVNYIPESSERHSLLRLLVETVGSLPKMVQLQIWIESLFDFASRPRMDLTSDLTAWTGLLASLGGELAVDEAIRSVIAVGSWFA